MIGRRLGEGGRYALDRELGRGGMGAVYRAVDTRLEALVAVKVLFPDFARNPKLRERFRNEARVQARLNHPSVVRATDWIEEGDTLAVVMDYVEGPSLEAALAQSGGALSPEDAWAVLSPVLDAVAHAHVCGVVHRDLKPANILLDRRATGSHRLGLPRVADFGIAKMLATTGPGMTVAGTVMGTPAYMSPEQLRGWIDLDQRADVYALGAITYQVLTGRPPYGYGEDVPRAMATGLAAAPSSVRPGVPVAVDAAIAQALALDRDARFGDVAAFKHALGAGLTGQPGPKRRTPAAPPPTVFEPPAPPRSEGANQPARRSPALFVALGGVAALLLAGVVMLAVLLSGDNADTPTAAAAGNQGSAEAARTAPSAPPAEPTPDPPPRSPCEAAEALAGHWEVNTLVVGTSKPTGGGVGVNGYYSIDLTLSGCQLVARVEKTGYAKNRFSSNKYQRGTTRWTAAWTLDGLPTAGGPLGLERSNGSARQDMILRLLLQGGQLRGWWRYSGAAWAEAGFWGVLRGKREGSVGRVDDSSDQPCSVLCHLACLGPEAPWDQPGAAGRLGDCVRRCDEAPPGTQTLDSVVCG